MFSKFWKTLRFRPLKNDYELFGFGRKFDQLMATTSIRPKYQILLLLNTLAKLRGAVWPQKQNKFFSKVIFAWEISFECHSL